MPEYTYYCNNCSSIFSIVCSIGNYKEQVVCSECKSQNTNRSYEHDLLSINTSVKKSDSELKTLGDLAQRNSDRFSNDQKIDLYMKHNSYKEQQSEHKLPSGMSRIKKQPKILWPGTTGQKNKRKPKNAK